MTTTPNKKTTIEDATKIVEEFFQWLKLDMNQCRAQIDNGIGWNVARGSALILISIQTVNDLDTIKVASPMLYLPQENLLPFYRRCLELNCSTLSCALAIKNDVLCCMSERSIQALDLAELQMIYLQVSHVADTFDNKLTEEFGGRIFTQGR